MDPKLTFGFVPLHLIYHSSSPKEFTHVQSLVDGFSPTHLRDRIVVNYITK